MHKILLILGLLLKGPRYGYELHQIIRAHGELYADLKKANLYYLLDRLAIEGDLLVESEQGTRGARGERLIYTLTDQGRQHFTQLLREVLQSYEPVHTGIETAIIFLASLPHAEGYALLLERRQAVAERRATLAAELDSQQVNSPLMQIASDHLLSLMDAELAWLDRSLHILDDAGWTKQTEQQAFHSSPLTFDEEG